jgi:hypothetical protein
MPTDDDVFGRGSIREDGRKLHPAYLMQVKSPSESTGPWFLGDQQPPRHPKSRQGNDPGGDPRRGRSEVKTLSVIGSYHRRNRTGTST